MLAIPVAMIGCALPPPSRTPAWLKTSLLPTLRDPDGAQAHSGLLRSPICRLRDALAGSACRAKLQAPTRPSAAAPRRDHRCLLGHGSPRAPRDGPGNQATPRRQTRRWTRASAVSGGATGTRNPPTLQGMPRVTLSQSELYALCSRPGEPGALADSGVQRRSVGRMSTERAAGRRRIGSSRDATSRDVSGSGSAAQTTTRRPASRSRSPSDAAARVERKVKPFPAGKVVDGARHEDAAGASAVAQPDASWTAAPKEAVAAR